MRAVDGLAGAQTPPVIKNLATSLVLASEQPKAIFRFYRFHIFLRWEGRYHHWEGKKVNKL